MLLFAACSKPVKETTILLRSDEKELRDKNTHSDIVVLKKLLSSGAPNLALAEFLAKSIAKEHSSDVKALIENLSVEEANTIINKVQADNQRIREHYLYHGASYQNNAALLSYSLVNSNSIVGHPLSVENQMKVATFAYLKSKSLDEIVSAYDKRANELSIDLAEDIAFDIGVNNPELAQEIESKMKQSPKETVLELIQKSKPLVEKMDEYFKSSELSENEQYTVAVSAIIAGAIYSKVKENNGFKKILAEGKKILRDAKELQRKAKEFVVLVNALEGHFVQTGKDIKDFSDGITGSREDLKSLYREVSLGSDGPVDVDSKKIVDFLYKKMISGEKSNLNKENASIFSKQVSFNENFTKSLTAAGNLTQNLSNIINTTNKLTALFGVKPSKDLQNVLDTAQKVSAVVSTVQSAIAGFATGGFVGALGALGSGPMMSMLGGGGSMESAKLDQINKKLDVVIKNQQKMMEMQIETMNMIKDLALMVDIYHQREMAALSELRDYSIVQLEIGKAGLNKDLRNCERMINFQLKSVWKNFNFKTDSFHSINTIDLLSSRFIGSITNLRDIQRIVTSVDEYSYMDCQRAISEAFGGSSFDENPVRLVFESGEQDNLLKFQREIFRPMLSKLKSVSKTDGFDAIPLHLPMKTFEGLEIKKHYVEGASKETQENSNYILTDLVSVKNLERYLSHMIVLLPLLELDKSVWMGSYTTIVDTYLMNANIHSNQSTRSHLFLTNALKIVQSGIAQEAIMTGEPVLDDLYVNDFDTIFSKKTCKKAVCDYRKNKLLLKNLLNFALFKESKMVNQFLERYKEAFDAKNIVALTNLINLGDESLVVEVMDDLSVIKLAYSRDESSYIRLPTPAEVEDGKIIYSENMARLLKMQDVILKNLEKVTPVKRDYQGNDLLKVIMIGA